MLNRWCGTSGLLNWLLLAAAVQRDVLARCACLASTSTLSPHCVLSESPHKLQAGMGRIQANLASRVKKGRMSKAAAQAAMARVKVGSGPS